MAKKTALIVPFGMGAKEDKKDPRDLMMKAIFAKGVPVKIPPRISYVSQMSPVKYQGQKGSCVPHGAIAVKEWQEKKQRKLKTFYDFSEDFVYDQIKLPGGGAYMRDGFKAIYNYGVCQEKMYPYTNVPDEMYNDVKWHPSKTALANAKNYKVGSYARIGTIGEIQQSLVVNGPCMTGIVWPYDWFWTDNWKVDAEGYPVLQTFSGGAAGGHDIVICGYDENQNWYIRNHWNTTWGFGGYAKIPFKVLDNYFWDTWSAVDITSKKINKNLVLEMVADAKKAA